MTSYSRQDVLRILQISSRQLQGWERAGLIPQQQSYTFQDLGQLRTLRVLREEDVPAASIRAFDRGHEGGGRHGQSAARGLPGAHRHASGLPPSRSHGRPHPPPVALRLRALAEATADRPASEPSSPRRPGVRPQRGVQDRFLAAVQAEESGEKQRAIALYEEILEIDPDYAPAYINLGTIYFHLRQFGRAEELYRRATEADPSYVLAFFDLGNVLDELERLDESIAAYRQAVALAPRYADAHYNLALAYERKGEHRPALRHWQAYVRLDNAVPGPTMPAGRFATAGPRKTRHRLARRPLLPPRKGLAALKRAYLGWTIVL